MKQLITIGFVAILMLQAPLVQAQKQKFAKRETALISYSLNIDNSYMHHFEQYAGDFRQPKNNKINPIKHQIMHTSWELIKHRLESQTGMIILPIDAYGKKFSYNESGFPTTSINTALNRGESKLYLKFDISIKPEPDPIYATSTTKNDSTASKLLLSQGKVLPIIRVDIVIYSNRGIIPICKTFVEQKAPAPLEINSALFDGFTNDKTTQEPKNLYGLLETTLNLMVGAIFAAN